MGDQEIPKLAEALIGELKKHGMSLKLCCGGLTPEESKKVKSWTRDGGFSEDQMEGLKHFADAMNTGKRTAKKWVAIGFGIIAVLALKDFWIWALKWLKTHIVL